MKPWRAADPDKSALRQKMLLKLQSMTLEDRAARSEKICARISGSPLWQQATRVLLFSPFSTEPQIAPLQSAATAAGGETFVVPPTLRAAEELDCPFAPDLVLVPGLAFSRDN